MLARMGRNTAPPLNSEAIRRARLIKGMTQADVQAECEARGVKLDRSGLSYIERGAVKRPAPKVIRVLSEVLGISADDMFEDGGGGGGGKNSPEPEGAVA